MKRLLPLLIALSGCPADQKLPGDENMGTFDFHAEPLMHDCSLADLAAGGFDFQAIFTHQRDGGAAWVTLNQLSRDASFDGQVLTSSHSAPRPFEACQGCETSVTETFTVALLSRSQNDALGDACPTEILDGGLPHDAGVTPPQSTDSGFDAVRACGVLYDTVHAEPLADGGSCASACNNCIFRFSLAGVRK